MSDAAAQSGGSGGSEKALLVPNPWDAPGSRRPRTRRKMSVAEKEKVKERSGEARKDEGCGEGLWDLFLFERQFGYT